MNKPSDTQAVTGSETMTRTIPSNINTGAIFQATYTSIGTTGNWGATIIEDVTGGCTPAHKETLFIYSTGDINSKSVDYISPSSGSCVFNGNYQFGDKSIKNFAQGTVSICTNHSSYKCDNGDVFWFNSCNSKEDLKQDCLVGCTGTTCDCATPADADCNGAISLTEIHSYGQKWLLGQVTRQAIGTAIQIWAQ